MTLKRRLVKLEKSVQTCLLESFGRECGRRSEKDLEFFADHGYWPEAATVVNGNGSAK